jgi:cytochrome c6
MRSNRIGDSWKFAVRVAIGFEFKEGGAVRTKSAQGRVILSGIAILGVFFLLSMPVKAQDTGEAIFKAKCAMCHGPDGSGKTKMGEMLKIPDLHSAEVQKLSEPELIHIVTKGKQKMPAYEGKISKEEIQKVVAYIREMEKKH